MHTLQSKKENKTLSLEDGTVKLNTSLFLAGLENTLNIKKKKWSNPHAKV